MYEQVKSNSEGVLVRINDVHVIDAPKVMKWLESRGYVRNKNRTGYVKTVSRDELPDEETVLKNYDGFRGVIQVFATGHDNIVLHQMKIAGRSL